MLAIASAVLVFPIGAKAQELEAPSFWYGYALGGAVVTCEWLKSGRLSRDDTKVFLKNIFAKNDKVPFAPLAKALDTIRADKDYSECPLPRQLRP